MDSSTLLLFGTTFFFGIRHGLDWDHLAAITDIVGSAGDRKTALVTSAAYIAGHALVVITFGLLAITLGITLPAWVDSVMGAVVGMTLVFLGLVLLWSVVAHSGEFKLLSRWGVIFNLISKLYHALQSFLGHTHIQKNVNETNLRPRTIFGIGMLHGIGAETPTQVLLFITIGGLQGTISAILLLGAFVVGLLISNTAISVFAQHGFGTQTKHATMYRLFGMVIAVLSLVVGGMFLFGKEETLPTLIR